MLQNQITLCCIWARWFKFSQFVQKTLWNQWGTCCLCQVKSWHRQKLGQGLTHIICLIWVLSIISRQPKILLAHLTTQGCHICILYDFSLWHLTLNQWQYVYIYLAVELGDIHKSLVGHWLAIAPHRMGHSCHSMWLWLWFFYKSVFHIYVPSQIVNSEI